MFRQDLLRGNLKITRLIWPNLHLLGFILLFQGILLFWITIIYCNICSSESEFVTVFSRKKRTNQISDIPSRRANNKAFLRDPWLLMPLFDLYFCWMFFISHEMNVDGCVRKPSVTCPLGCVKDVQIHTFCRGKSIPIP